MRSVLFFFPIFILFSLFTLSAGALNATKAIFFYRDKTSLFPSGQASRTVLTEKLHRSETEILFVSSWDKKEFLLEGEQLLRDIQLSRFVDTRVDCRLLSHNQSNASLIKSVPAKTQLEILDVEGFWARVKIKDSSIQGWITLPYLQPLHNDLGYFVNIMDTHLRQEPKSDAKVIITVPRLTRIQPMEINKYFLKVKYENKIGYVNITDFVSRADFANFAYHPKKNWIAVSYRKNDQIITKQGEEIPLKEFLGYATSSRRGVVVRADSSYGPPLRSRVDILKLEAHDWGISTLAGHGEIWWKKKNLLLETAKNISSNTISTDTLMKREIYSIAFENKNSLRGIISSEGVYRTEDGVTWTLIPQFGKKNYPVSIHPNGAWFVGPFKSNNQGKTFEPFIRWDHIAQVIESAYHQNPKILRLTQIEAMPNSQIQIHIETGHNKIKLRSSLNDIRWNVIKK